MLNFGMLALELGFQLIDVGLNIGLGGVWRWYLSIIYWIVGSGSWGYLKMRRIWDEMPRADRCGVVGFAVARLLFTTVLTIDYCIGSQTTFREARSVFPD